MKGGSPALEFEGISFAYPGGPTVVRNVRLRVEPGEMVGLIGPNGAGKSTMLGLAAGALAPTAGRMLLQGDDVAHLGRLAVAQRLAVVPQEFIVQFAYTVRQIVDLGRLPHTGAWHIPGPMDRMAVADALAATDLVALADRVFNELSGGERQRVLIALAMAQQTPIVLLDEPTAHLDIRHQIEVLHLMERLNRERGLTIVAVMHDLNLAARYFARLVLLHHEIVADGSPAQVLDEALLTRVYDTAVRVGILRGESYLSVSPPGAASAGSSEYDGRRTVHVIAGGGTGEILMRTLADAHLAFTAGPLNVGDSDAILAERLAQQCLVEPPYAPISAQGVAAAKAHMAESAMVVLCPIPLGHGNAALVRAVAEAGRMGTRVVLLEPELAVEPGGEVREALLAAVARRDFSGEGSELYADLLDAGAEIAYSPATALALLATG